MLDYTGPIAARFEWLWLGDLLLNGIVVQLPRLAQAGAANERGCAIDLADVQIPHGPSTDHTVPEPLNTPCQHDYIGRAGAELSVAIRAADPFQCRPTGPLVPAASACYHSYRIPFWSSNASASLWDGAEACANGIVSE